MERRTFLRRSGGLALVPSTANPWLASSDLGFTNMRFSRSERGGSRFVTCRWRRAMPAWSEE